MQELRLNVTTANDEMVVRTGKAPDVIIPTGQHVRMLPQSMDELVTKKIFNPECTLVEVDKENGSIVIETNIKNTYQSGSDIYSTHLVIDSTLDDFGINKNHYWEPKELSRLIKMNRNLVDGGLELAGKLNNLIAKVNKNIEKRQDDRANTIDRFEQEVQTNLPETIKISSKIFKGYEKEFAFDADVNFKMDGRNVQIFLTSFTLKETMEQLKNEILDEVVLIIRKEQPDLVIVEV
jgi:hypothetical protein